MQETALGHCHALHSLLVFLEFNAHADTVGTPLGVIFEMNLSEILVAEFLETPPGVGFRHVYILHIFSLKKNLQVRLLVTPLPSWKLDCELRRTFPHPCELVGKAVVGLQVLYQLGQPHVGE